MTSSSAIKLKKVLKQCKNKNKHQIYQCDLSSNSEINEFTNFVKKKFSTIDIILHIAGGGFGINNYLPENNDYEKVFKINLFSIFEINRHLVPIMKRKKKGTIFHVGSIAANESVGSLSYNVAKSSLSSYVRTLAKHLAAYNICITGINPGGFEYYGNAMIRLKKNNPKAYKEFISNRLPLKRMPKAKELLPIIYLAIGKDNISLTGSMISCDFGEGNFY